MAIDAVPDSDSRSLPRSTRTLSAELKALTESFAEQAVTLREVMDRLGARASGLLVLILALPFCAPVTIPGLSTPFGLVIAFIAGRFALGLAPWLPNRLLAIKLPPKFFKIVVSGTGRFVSWVERRLHTRWRWLTDPPSLLRLHSWTICFSAILMALPLGGIPFTNTLPGLAVFVGMIGIMERDGAAILISYGLLLGTIIYFGTFATVFIEMMHHAIAWWQSR
jgi:hypothetical protein